MSNQNNHLNMPAKKYATVSAGSNPVGFTRHGNASSTGIPQSMSIPTRPKSRGSRVSSRSGKTPQSFDQYNINTNNNNNNGNNNNGSNLATNPTGTIKQPRLPRSSTPLSSAAALTSTLSLTDENKRKPPSHVPLEASTSPPAAVSSVEGSGAPVKKVRKKDAIEMLISSHPMIIKSELLQLRYLVLMEGLKVSKGSTDGICSYRPYVWSILLRVSPEDFPYTQYLDLVSRGPHTVYSKIRNDTFRTFTTDPNFRKRVSEDALIRVLNSFAWQRTLDQQASADQAHSLANSGSGNDAGALNSLANMGLAGNNNVSARSGKKRLSDTSDVVRRTSIAMANSEATGISPGDHAAMQSAIELRNKEFSYIQGMNVLAAPFLYQCKSEAQAFALFYTFLTRDCPLYVIPTLDGAHFGIKLVDLCLEVIDPTLFEYLKSKFLIAELYAFTSVLTFSAGTPPLSEALVIWDALFAYGPHLNILFVIAQLTLMRNQLLEFSSPMSLLRNFPPLRAREIIKLGVSFIQLLPDHLYDLLVRHPYDPLVGQEIGNRAQTMPQQAGSNSQNVSHKSKASVSSILKKQRSLRPLNR